MNTVDVLENGHQIVLATLDGLAEEDWETPGVCGVWSVKEIVAHLASFEHVAVDVLGTFLYDGPTPTLNRLRDGFEAFNQAEVASRRKMRIEDLLAEYSETYTETSALVAQIPIEMRRHPGTVPWYGAQYALNDFIAYTFYGHKREHCTQITLFRERMDRKASPLERS